MDKKGEEKANTKVDDILDMFNAISIEKLRKAQEQLQNKKSDEFWNLMSDPGVHRSFSLPCVGIFSVCIVTGFY